MKYTGLIIFFFCSGLYVGLLPLFKWARNMASTSTSEGKGMVREDMNHGDGFFTQITNPSIYTEIKNH